MAKVQKRTFSLSEEQAGFIDRKVASGDYVSGSEVIREGLRAMQERDAAIEKWLREEVVPAIQQYEADPSSARPAEVFFEELLAEEIADAPKRKRA
ncbi:MAG: type II toxin-antitoxin system ParD family antitoxin [Devosia sp.]